MIAEENRVEFTAEVSRLESFIEVSREAWEKEWLQAFYLWKPGKVARLTPEGYHLGETPVFYNLQEAVAQIEQGIALRDEELSFLTAALQATSIAQDREELPPLLPSWRGFVQLVDRCRLDVKGFQGRLEEKSKECIRNYAAQTKPY